MTHQATVKSRDGQRRSTFGVTFYRWECPCGDAGRWTRQWDTALEGAIRHDVRSPAP